MVGSSNRHSVGRAYPWHLGFNRRARYHNAPRLIRGTTQELKSCADTEGLLGKIAPLSAAIAVVLAGLTGWAWRAGGWRGSRCRSSAGCDLANNVTPVTLLPLDRQSKRGLTIAALLAHLYMQRIGASAPVGGKRRRIDRYTRGATGGQQALKIDVERHFKRNPTASTELEIGLPGLIGRCIAIILPLGCDRQATAGGQSAIKT